jgi:hypothetical protein
MSIIICRPKSLPVDKLFAAERRAIDVNPDKRTAVCGHESNMSRPEKPLPRTRSDRLVEFSRLARP